MSVSVCGCLSSYVAQWWTEEPPGRIAALTQWLLGLAAAPPVIMKNINQKGGRLHSGRLVMSSTSQRSG